MHLDGPGLKETEKVDNFKVAIGEMQMNQMTQHRLKIEDAKFSFLQYDKENFLISFMHGQRRNLSSRDRSILELLFAARLLTILVLKPVGI